MPDQITAPEQPIEKIFSEEFLFSIPGYQRPYAWTTEQAGELFDDLSDAMRAQAGAVREIPPYFLGSIVLTKVPSEGARPRHHVIDGQQRLTTLTILLSALRDCLDSDVGLHLTSMIYERGNPIRGHREQFRLQLREKDRVFFEEQIQREGMIGKLASGDSKLSDSQGKIRENARLLLERVRTLSADEMFRLTQFIAQRCYLVVVATPDRDSAYRIFAVMNSRGLDLAPTDILKSEILGGIEEADQLKYERKWEEVEDQLGRDPFTELFSHIRMIYRQAKPKGTLLK